MSWKTLRDALTRNWKEKLLALLLAVLFWIMIKEQVKRRSHRSGWQPVPRAEQL